MNRRRAMFLSANAAVGLALRPKRTHAQTSAPGPQMSALSAYMSAAANRDLPAEVVEQARHHLLDTLAAMISGSQLLPGEMVQRYIKTNAGKGSAIVAGTALSAATVDAAFANGVMAHSDETDDSHNASRSHPGCAAIPAALAIGAQLRVDGAHLLRAVTLGYDVGTRVAMSMGGFAFSNATSLATHSIAGTFCAAAAAGCVAGLDAQQMRWVLDYSAQQSSGIAAWRRDIDHIEKAFVFGGMTARNGVTAALVVHSGWTGVDDVFSGDDNFFAAYAPEAQPERLTDKLGERYEITQTDIKKWTVGSPIQGVLDALQVMRSKRSFAAEQVKRVTVRLAPVVAEVVDNREIPDICLQHMVAVMLLDGTASFHAAHDKARMQDANVLRERAKITLVHDKELAALLPVRVAIVEVELRDGVMLVERVEAVRGTPRNPMTRAEVMDKARDLVVSVLGRDQTERLIGVVYEVEKLRDVRVLQSLMARGPK